MTMLPHPFYKKSSDFPVPEDKVKVVDEFHKWIKDQERFPNYSREHAHLFLHACIWDMPAAKKAIQKYGSIRLNSPDVFGDRDPMLPEMQFVYENAYMISLPKLTPEGYRLLVYRLRHTDPSKVNFGEATKAFCMFNDVQISEDGPINGYVVIFDMKGVRLGHLAKVQFGPLRTFMNYIQEAHPVRLKKIYIVHTASFINQIMALVRPLIKSELLGLLKFTTNGPSEFFGPEYLPEDYGGELKSIEEFHVEQRKFIETEYRDWLIDTNNLRDAPKDKKAGYLSSKITSFKSLEID
ncbi:uncharacterized protein LOC134836970 [Culicoides brevitarsis]|uniref:uncharacterized protein LOC134836970 n=1 Tax=Culicoides brevitarsis TaxID=469753 RepID=UPI00307B31C5